MLSSFFTTYLAHITLIALLLIGVKIGAKHRYKTTLNHQWLALTALCYFGYLFIDYNKFKLIEFNHFKPLLSTIIPSWPTLSWAWDVTFTACFYCLILLVLFNKFDLYQVNDKKAYSPSFQPLYRRIGFTLKQHKNSLKPCIIAFMILLIARYYLSLIVGGDDGVRDPEELLFLLMAEGTDKALFFFGLLPFMLSRVFINNPVIYRHKVYRHKLVTVNLSFLGAALTFATFNGLKTVGLEHNLIFLSSFILMGIYAVIFLWMRQITGSLVLPVVCYGVLMFFSQLL